MIYLCLSTEMAGQPIKDNEVLPLPLKLQAAREVVVWFRHCYVSKLWIWRIAY